ncbi:MAG: glycerol-3-phosphate 1-O-acyltransferase PlsY [Candidatus Omnitrophica bacterium]|nr:glycerol-3-phosphate 1-O-acyltransferase PlsY [Candidatus Omnitrophota bacterium]
MARIILASLISYLIGSIPTAYIFGRVLKGIDIRKSGSGNVGATNAFRVLGKIPGITVLIIDILKGLFCVVVVGRLVSGSGLPVSDTVAKIVLGLICICGHNWTIFLQFKGGKGVAATVGVLIGLAIIVPGLGKALLLTVAIWAVTFAIFRTVSLSSVLSSICLPIFVFLFKQPPEIMAVCLVLSIFILLRHRSNIQRIIQGKERRLF